MNFTFQRNPERLLDLCGMPSIRDRRQEKLFMEKAAALDAQDLRPLVLVIGGFLDQVLGNSYAVSARYPADLRARHDVWFREHYESRKMRDIVNLYASKGHSVALVGHSWGGDAAVNLVARKLDAPIDLLISLDPVSRKGAPRRKIPNVRHWLNIHIDYSQEHLARYPQSRGPHRRPVGSREKRRRERLLSPGHDPCVGMGDVRSATAKKSCGNTPKAGSKKKVGRGTGTFCRKFPVPLPKTRQRGPRPPLPFKVFYAYRILLTGLGKSNVEASEDGGCWLPNVFLKSYMYFS